MSMSSHYQVSTNSNSHEMESVHRNNQGAESPEFTEFGIKISKLRLTFKLRRRRRRSENPRAQESLQQEEDDNILINDLSDTVLRTLDLDSSPRSRIPINSTTNANMEFTGFYTAPPSVYTSSSSSGSSGYGSSLSTNSDLYSEVYSESLRACPPPPPLPPRLRSERAPARPPYPSSIVRVVQEITEPISR